MVTTPADTGTGSLNEPARPTVFFDGSCPLCTAEIATYRKCRGADDIDWIDVAESTADAGGETSADTIAPGLSRADAMRRFHMRRADGAIVSGGAAFAELWASLPAFSRAGQLGRWRPVAVLLEGAYRLFLPVRPLLQKLVRTRKASP